uniref:Uncharacterized protein n=1 Tax=viral metagenome TaxID=1070528 RepID=A0A6C0JSH3_9ZZZZ
MNASFKTKYSIPKIVLLNEINKKKNNIERKKRYIEFLKYVYTDFDLLNNEQDDLINEKIILNSLQLRFNVED